jgi:hypothetical protein
MVGNIDPLGTTFQSAIALRNSTISARKAISFRLSRHSRDNSRMEKRPF